ncbi:helix-turn-helix transcriptional regulator [Halococcus saccharolyticus]|uniref:helix-turn-helix transcriptional regulator n=1 Tax=Halococcus saccharolyticus TaxID=62319 RepID=UPI0006779E19|nr:helix-turn-helix transcriptional regulator [Halococcus saccharolyticus]
MAENGRRDRNREEHGHYAEEYPIERVRAVFEGLTDPCEPVTAAEVADKLGSSRKTAYNKLNALKEQDEVRTKKVAARGRVWWVKGSDGG